MKVVNAAGLRNVKTLFLVPRTRKEKKREQTPSMSTKSVNKYTVHHSPLKTSTFLKKCGHFHLKIKI